jgi:hypothetical protein
VESEYDFQEYDFLVVRDMIQERIGRKLVCECQLLNDEKVIRRKELEQIFGIDFGEPGNRAMDVL